MTSSAPAHLRAAGRDSAASVRLWTKILLSLTAANCLFQIVWFWRRVSHNVNFDAVSYIGIARHLADGDFRASLNGYWSPLVSWCIAALAKLTADPLLAGRIVTLASFLICLPLLYFFSLRLWHNPALAALSIFCFSLARGVAAFSVSFIGADFLLTAAVIVYFTLLLECLRGGRTKWWILLGLAQAIAFLAKAFAMPWLTISTILGAVLAGRRKPGQFARHLAAGMLIPAVVWVGWGTMLSAKYGRFTAGYQAKVNLLDTAAEREAQAGGLKVLMNTSDTYDRYMVVDRMPPGSPLWSAHVSLRRLLPQIFNKELKTLPAALKQIVILVTPAGLLAFVFVLAYLDWEGHWAEKSLAWIIAVEAVTLMLGYCMLVFDERYVLPLVPLMIATAVSALLLAGPAWAERWLPITVGVLFALSTVFFLVYHGSPFRKLTRDYQTSVYSTSAALERLPECGRLIVIGEGPFPDRGVGWEAGIYASYFAGCRMVGFAERIPAPQIARPALGDIQSLRGDAILLFGRPQDKNYEQFRDAINQDGGYRFFAPLSDSQASEVGSLFRK